MPRPARARMQRPRKYTARTSLLTGEITVRVPAGSAQVYRDALEVHEITHRGQWLRYRRRHGPVMGPIKFAACRFRPACKWELEREAYFWEIAYLVSMYGAGKIPRLGWKERLVQEGYQPDRVEELLDEVYRKTANRRVPYCLDRFLGCGWFVPG